MEVTLIRSDRKTLSLCVTREGEVVVRAPRLMSPESIENFLARHSSWIQKRLQAVAARPVLSLETGAEVVLFGSVYRVRTGRPRIKDGELYLPEEGREAAAVRLLKKFSQEVMAHVTARIAGEHGFCYRAVRISSARGRWGSCNRDGVIAYTFRVAFLPPALCEYVVVHELAHTVVFDHSAKFWEVVGDILPDWKARRKALKANYSMEFL